MIDSRIARALGALAVVMSEACGGPPATPPTEMSVSGDPAFSAARDRVELDVSLADSAGHATSGSGLLMFRLVEHPSASVGGEGTLLCDGTVEVDASDFDTPNRVAHVAIDMRPACPAADLARMDGFRELLLSLDGPTGPLTLTHAAPSTVRLGGIRPTPGAPDPIAAAPGIAPAPVVEDGMERLRAQAARIRSVTAAPPADGLSGVCPSVEAATAALIAEPHRSQLAGVYERPACAVDLHGTTSLTSTAWAEATEVLLAGQSPRASQVADAIDAFGPYVWVLVTNQCVSPEHAEGTSSFVTGVFDGALVLGDTRDGTLLCSAPVHAESSEEVVAATDRLRERMRDDFDRQILVAVYAARTALAGDHLFFPPVPPR
jgi:hypothetical protein